MAVVIAVAKDGEIAVGHDTCWGPDQTEDGRIKVERLEQHEEPLGLVLACDAPAGIADVLQEYLRGVINDYGANIWRKEWARRCNRPNDPTFDELRWSHDGAPYFLLAILQGEMFIALTNGATFERQEIAAIGTDWEEAMGATMAILRLRPDFSVQEVVHEAILSVAALTLSTNADVHSIVITDDTDGLTPPPEQDE